MVTFNPDTDIPDLSGKVVVVTGGSSGLGKETVHQLAKHNPERIYLSARTEQRGNVAIKKIERAVPAAKSILKYLEMDLGSFASISKAARTLRAETDRLDILINNAGLIASPPGLTTDGYEVQFGSNYVGPALLTKLLLPLLEATAAQPSSDVRVINLSSELFKQAPSGGILLDRARTPMSETSSLARYGQSKLADYFHTKLLAERYPKIRFIALHPGVVNTGIFDDFKKRRPYLGYGIGILGSLFSTDVHQGAHAQLWASTTAVSNIRSGGFYNPSHKQYVHKSLNNDILAAKLWDWTENEFQQHGY